MTKADQFRLYAEEAMRWARQSNNNRDHQALVELACTWTRAAAQSEGTVVIKDNPPAAVVA
jgi:hypothetical protein